ncbi:Protein of unknown function [Noviherbaspirillum humi]|uniref:DUF3131 domain-containing protein n=1 Tax=Noviherbaspirillum humi TaxID=1688639 RepID=A0A239DN99_9BURK|nr:DUF3131 domain-containing protein [Noviherbaspirillum humi]SNS33591.1 Protein of unknown function [Noviherbaspirillum humi]
MSGNLVKARSSIIFILAVILSCWAVWEIEQHSSMSLAAAQPAGIQRSADLPAAKPVRPLNDQERQWAQAAWKYFEANTHPDTGLANSVAGYPAATMWDTASYLLGLISARRLDLVGQQEFDRRMARALESLGRLPLFDNALPNKSYSTADLAMVDYTGKPTEKGIGWSAIDLGRLLVPLNAVVWQYPRHAAAASRVLARWDTSRLARDGELFGALVEPEGNVGVVQEGRLGYEQYAAHTFALMGLDVARAADPRQHLAYADVFGVQIPYDSRDPKKLGAHQFVVSEPYMLDGLEFGWDSHLREFAWRVFRAQQERFRRTGVLTAVSEDHVDQAPYFVYNTVFSDGKAWNTVTEKGEPVPKLRTVSVKAAFAWHALYGNEYTARLVESLADLQDPDKGWYAGRYEETGQPNKSVNANTNGIVLESLAYIATGKLLGRAAAADGK